MAGIRHKRLAFTDHPVQINYTRGSNPRGHTLAWHNDMEIQFIKEGRGYYFIEGTSVAFRENSVIIIHPREIHRLLPHPDQRVEKWCVIFKVNNMAWPKPMLTDIARLKRHIRLTTGESENIEQIICKIRQETKHHEPCWISLINTMLMELLLRIKRSETNVLPYKMHPIVNRALDYIEQHYNIASFKVGKLATCLNISERHLARLFMADVGVSIKHYVSQRRVLQAQRMFRSNPALKLETVSAAVGFGQYSLFYRMFKILTGSAPCAHV